MPCSATPARGPSCRGFRDAAGAPSHHDRGMATQPSSRTHRTFLVECFGTAGRPAPRDHGFLATLAIAEDEQLLVLVRGGDEAVAARQCVAAGLTVDRVVEVTLSPRWRWRAAEEVARPRAPASRR
jgi:hypothetical protein